MVFLHTYGISSGRLDRLLKKKQDGTIMEKDKRGMHGKQQGVRDEIKDDLKAFIAKIPKYRSHYKDNADLRYLAPNVKKIDVYNMWKENSSKNFGDALPTYEWFLSFWKKELSLKIHTPSTDCCATCDELKHSGQLDKLQTHHKWVEDARRKFKEDCSKPYTVSFDMEKTLPLPYIQTNKVFYLRQLWLYNEGFNHTVNNQAYYMYCWTEGTAKRGSVEVISCMLKFLRSIASTWPELVLWSDTCGGQNRNFNMTASLITLVNDSDLNIKKVTHRYLWSGHSFLPNDTNFSHIEKKKKHAVGIYSPEEYVEMMKNERKTKKFHVHKMESKDFFQAKKLTESLANRRVDEDGEVFSSNKIHEMVYEEGLTGFLFRYNFSEERVRKVDLTKRNLAINSLRSMALANPNGVRINWLKYKDRMQLLKFIPQVYHDEYKAIRHDKSEEDEVFPEEV